MPLNLIIKTNYKLFDKSSGKQVNSDWAKNEDAYLTKQREVLCFLIK